MARVALVTEGSRGIGAAISEKALKQNGFTVAASYAGNDEAARFKSETKVSRCSSGMSAKL